MVDSDHEDFIKRRAVKIKETQIETFEKINKIDDKFIVRYCHHAKQLQGTARKKSLAYFNKKKIRWDYDQKCFLVDPLPGCHTVHTIEKKKVGFECSCQKCQERIKKGEYDPDIEDGVPCSHIGGLYLWFKLGHPHQVETE